MFLKKCLRAGIIGIGSWYSKAFASAINKMPEIHLVCAAHLGQDNETLKAAANITRESYAETFQVKLYETAEEMIRKESLDMVFISSKNSSKPTYAALAAKSGLDVYLAKPMCATLEGAEVIVKACRKYSKVLMATLNPARYDGAISEMYTRVETGEIGETLTARAWIQHGAFRSDFRFDGSPEFEKGQGGIELSLGVYAADLLNWLIGSEAIRVYAEYDNLNTKWSPFMDTGKAIVRYENGKIGSMDIIFSTICPAPLWEMEVVGSKAIIRTHQTAFEGVIWRTETSDIIPFYRNQNDVMVGALRRWVRSCLERTTPDLPVEEAEKVIELCLAWKKSAETRKIVSLPLK